MIPTQSGYYWREGPTLYSEGETLTQIVEVGPLVSTNPDELFFWQPGEMGGIFIQEDPNVKWAGPIPEPTLLTELLERYVGEQHAP
jgi:hypothetical protein